MPRLLLQPLVENAVRHGLAAKAPASWLVLRTCKQGGSLSIEVSNSAADHGERGFGIGLENTRARLAQIYGPSQVLSVRRLADRFEVALQIPWREAPAARSADA